MRLALIPPISLLEYTKRTDYHLMLPQLLDNGTYRRHYMELCASENDFVILDNGLAEGYFATTHEMINLAIAYGPDEVVIPDTMKDFLGNVSRCESFLAQWLESFVPGEVVPGLMFVCQGQSLGEFIASGIWASSQAQITSIGIPRHAIETCNNRRARIVIANALQNSIGWNRPIHFLGASPLWSVELLYAASYEETDQTWMRGMDTSMPFNYAFALESVASGISISRPDDYFDLIANLFISDLIETNVETMLGWAK